MLARRDQRRGPRRELQAAYTEGDNREVVATDTMKNFILREALAYEGATLEGLIRAPGRGFLATYPVMEAVRMTGREHRFDRVTGKLFARESRRPRRRRASSVDAGGLTRPPQRPRGPAAAQGHRQRVHQLRPRRLHDAARAHRPPAVRAHGRALALRRPRAPTTSTRARCATRSPPPSTTSSASRSSTSCTRWASACSTASRRSPRSASRPRTTRATPPATTARAGSTPTRSPPRA